jgi:hypothetical protein
MPAFPKGAKVGGPFLGTLSWAVAKTACTFPAYPNSLRRLETVFTRCKEG